MTLRSNVYPFSLPFMPEGAKEWTAYPIFRGATRILDDCACHVSVLTSGHAPHQPHRHDEEEILIVLSGEIDIILEDEYTTGETKHARLTPGQFVYYPAHHAHTLQTASDEPANYLMLKWCRSARQQKKKNVLGYGLFDARAMFVPSENRKGVAMRLTFEDATAYLHTLHCHATTIVPGASYPAHADDYDVVIIMLDGWVETLGKRIGPAGVIFYAAGEPHGMANPGTEPARYLVFELHGWHRPFSQRVKVCIRKLTDPHRWIGAVRSVIKKRIRT